MSVPNPNMYLTAKRLSDLDERFNKILKGTTCLVFWTGVPLALAQDWAARNNLKTMATAMGPSYGDTGSECRRFRSKPEAWGNIMKGVSALYAQHACQRRQVVLLTGPPPDIYGKNDKSIYRTIEEPILKGTGGGASTLRIDLVHPTVPGASGFRYQIWPVDKSAHWYAFMATLSAKMTIRTIIDWGRSARSAVESDAAAQAENSGTMTSATKLRTPCFVVIRTRQ